MHDHRNPRSRAATVTTEDARQGATLGAMRYVLVLSVALAIGAMTTAYLVAL